jgi:FMNH2-dependent dimethyl sulfone monooxygenase
MAFFGGNRFKFGLFGINCGGGMTLSAAPERWTAEWSEIEKVAILADAAGIEFILPIAKWHGLGGEADMWGRSFETFTQAAALGALTKSIGIFVTAHVPLVTPAFAAKAVVTIDHVTGGRAGLNIVCGWNQDEFDVHGIVIDPDRRYDQGLEWAQIFTRLLEGGAPFDWDSAFYKLRGAATNPVSVQRPHPPLMSAAQSGEGRKFAAQVADILFTSMHGIEQASDTLRRLQGQAAEYGRCPAVYVETQMICRPTRKEAEDYYYYFAEEKADTEALAYLKRQRIAGLSKSARTGESAAERTLLAKLTEPTGKLYSGIFPGMYPIVGTPDDIVAELGRVASLGLAGSALVFLNYLEELPYFVQEVLPRMEKAGLRQPHRPAA